MPRDNSAQNGRGSPTSVAESSPIPAGIDGAEHPSPTRSQGSSATDAGGDESTKNQVTESQTRQFVPCAGGPPATSQDGDGRSEERLILVIEDDPDLREALVIVLEAEGHAVVQAPDGREAADLIEHGLRPSLIVLDIAMPEMDGHEFREWQLEDRERAAVPAIGYSAVPDPKRASRLLGIPVFRKPSELGEMIRMVRRGSQPHRS